MPKEGERGACETYDAALSQGQSFWGRKAEREPFRGERMVDSYLPMIIVKQKSGDLTSLNSDRCTSRSRYIRILILKRFDSNDNRHGNNGEMFEREVMTKGVRRGGKVAAGHDAGTSLSYEGWYKIDVAETHTNRLRKGGRRLRHKQPNAGVSGWFAAH
jgi:hypothetical protein